MAFQKILRAERLREGEIALGRLGVRPVALVRQRGRLFAFKNTCPHAGSPLSAGRLGEGWIECARHRWRFPLDGAECADHPAYCLRTYEVRERDGWIEVDEGEAEIW